MKNWLIKISFIFMVGLVFVVFNPFARAEGVFRLISAGACGEDTDNSSVINKLFSQMKDGDALVADCVSGVGAEGLLLQGKKNISVSGENGGGFKTLAQTSQSVSGFSHVMFVIRNSEACKIQNLSWNGNNIGASAFGLEGNSSCRITNNTLLNIAYPASAALVAVNNRNNIYEYNTISGTGAGQYQGRPDGTRGMWLGNAGSDKAEWYPLVRGNKLSNIAATGIAVMGISPLIENNTVIGTNGAGIKFVQGDGGGGKAVVQDNILSQNSLHGIQIDDRVRQSLSVSVKRNTITSNGLAGIYAPAELTDSDISENIVRNNHTNGLNGWHGGIMVYNANRLLITSNISEDTSAAPTQDIGLIINPLGGLAAQNVEIRNNIFKSNTRHGVALYNDEGNITNLAFMGNGFIGNSQYGIFIYQKPSGTIIGISLKENCFSGNLQGSISDSNRGNIALNSQVQEVICKNIIPSPAVLPEPTSTQVGIPDITPKSPSTTSPALPQNISLVSVVKLGEAFNQHGGWAGFKFTVGEKALYVSELGRMTLSGNTQTHKVKLLTAPSSDTQSSGNESLGTVSVSTGGKIAGQFAYSRLAVPVMLQPNTTYYLVSEEFYGGDFFYNGVRGGFTKINSEAAKVNSAVYWWSGDPYWRMEGEAGAAHGPLDLKFSYEKTEAQKAEQILKPITLVNNKSLKIVVQPVSFADGKWKIKISWQRTLASIGSVYLNSASINSRAPNIGFYETYLKAGVRHKLEFYSKSNKAGLLLARKYFSLPTKP